MVLVRSLLKDSSNYSVVLLFITKHNVILRVGGFVLSHAGMMLVVYTLAEMVSGVGRLAVIILGNIFVMCRRD